TLHALWPFLWIWAMLYRPERGWGFAHGKASESEIAGKLDNLFHRVEELEARSKLARFPARAERVGAKEQKHADLATSDETLDVDAKRGGSLGSPQVE